MNPNFADPVDHQLKHLLTSVYVDCPKKKKRNTQVNRERLFYNMHGDSSEMLKNSQTCLYV